MNWEQIIKNQERQRDSGRGAPQRVKPKPPTVTTRPTITTRPDVGVDDRPDVEDVPESPPHCQCEFPTCQQKAAWKCQYCGAIMCNFHKTHVTTRRNKQSGRLSEHIHSFRKGSCDENHVFKWD
jgi:hypothetical protein